jgi:hypothetical protein
MDRENLVERLAHNPMWVNRQYSEYRDNVLFRNWAGTQERLPMASFVTPPVANHTGRVPQSSMRLNEWHSRYHFPSGLSYSKVDFERVMNSSPKDTPGYINQPIMQNTGIFGTGF